MDGQIAEFRTRRTWISFVFLDACLCGVLAFLFALSPGLSALAALLLALSALEFFHAYWIAARPRLRITETGFELPTSIPPVSYAWEGIEGIDCTSDLQVDFRLVNGERITVNIYPLAEEDRKAFAEIARTFIRPTED